MIALALLSCKHASSAPPAAKRSDADAALLVPWLYEAVPTQEQYGYVTRDGKTAFRARFTDARQFHEGRAAVATAQGHAGFIDADGNVVVSLMYDFVDDFRNGRARVFHFRAPVLGPVQNVILRDGELTEATIDLAGHESGVTKTTANVIPPGLFPDPRPITTATRWEIFMGEGGKQGLREIATKREVFAASYGGFKYIQDIDGSGFKFLASKEPNNTPPPGPRWTVYDMALKPIATDASDVGEYSSEGCFTIEERTGDMTRWTWTAIDGNGHRVLTMPYASEFFFKDGIAAVTVTDLVVPIYASREGRIYATIAAVDARHHSVGREPIAIDRGVH